MGSMSIWHWIIVGGVALVLFGGKGKISDLMGDFAKGIKSFKKGMAEDDSTDVSHPVERAAYIAASGRQHGREDGRDPQDLSRPTSLATSPDAAGNPGQAHVHWLLLAFGAATCPLAMLY